MIPGPVWIHMAAEQYWALHPLICAIRGAKIPLGKGPLTRDQRRVSSLNRLARAQNRTHEVQDL